ncbi:hypothetical protein EDD86DRAFT_112107 [Gorgonomyces haynaldii]|nr:hypothetical protein EDD86DRAFT_112107 [Gorgonomyces haynaldii]
MLASPSRDLAHFAGLEDKFCKDFFCCGKELTDLHDLLQHFEENHVCLESDIDDEDLPFEFEHTDEMEMDSSDEKPFDIYLKQHGQKPAQSIALADICAPGFTPLSAFDTNVIRKQRTKTWKSAPSDEQPQTIPINTEGPTNVIHDDEPMELDEPKEEEVSNEKEERPYKCKVAGCSKAYKNPGGLKYHMQHGHCEDTGDPEMNNIIHKPYQCTVPDCGKRYKNLNGLKYHIEHAHSSLLGPK